MVITAFNLVKHRILEKPVKPVKPEPKHPKLDEYIMDDDEHVKLKERKDDWKARNVQTIYTDQVAERNNLSLLFIIDKLNELVRATGSLSG